MENASFMQFVVDNLAQFWTYTAFANVTIGHLAMIAVGLFFIYLAIAKEYEPMLLVPIGFGIIIGNIAFTPGFSIGIYEDGSVMNYLYFGVIKGIYPPLIFLGIGAMTDFSALISNPKLILIGAAAQIGIFAAYAIALALGFSPAEAGAIGIIGGVANIAPVQQRLDVSRPTGQGDAAGIVTADSYRISTGGCQAGLRTCCA